MSSRRNFLDADDSIMERNLRFVKNDLEENLNQYFGGSNGRDNNSNTVTAPPRDYKVVQPKPDGSHAHGLEKRRRFLLELGLARHEAYELAKNSEFDVKTYEEKCQRWLRNGFQKDEIVKEILFDIHDENNRNKSSGHHEHVFPAKTFQTEHYERGENFERQYNEMDQHGRNYSRSDFKPEEIYRSSSSTLLKRNINTLDDRNRGEYFSENSDFRNEINKSTYRRRSPSPRCSPPRSYRREEIVYSSRSRSPFNARRNVEYLSQPENFREYRNRSRSFSPPRTYTSRSRSPNRDFRDSKDEDNFLRYNKYGVEEKRMTFSGQPHTRPFSPCRNESHQQMRSHSPGRKSEGFMLDYDYSRDEFRKFSRAYSPPRHERVQDHRKFSRSRSPIGRYFAHDKRPYSPPKANRGEEFHRSSRSQSSGKSYESRNDSRRIDFSTCNMNISNDPSTSTDRFHSHEINNKNKFTNNQKTFERNMTGDKKIPSLLEINVTPNRNQNTKQFSQKSNIPSLFDINVTSHQGQNTNQLPQKSNIPSLLSLQVFPEKNVQHPSTSSKQIKPRDFKSNMKQKQTQHRNRNRKKSEIKGRNKRFPQANPQLKPYHAYIAAIPTGLKKPQPGHLKANPQYYWSQWWPQYKYIEYSLPEIDSNDIQIQKCIKFKFDSDFLTQQRKRVLLKNGIKKILKTSGINEKNYYSYDIFKIFKYKKHLEDPTFQNSLTPQELNCIAPALRQFQIKSTLAYLHQALIVKWHVSLDIIKKVQAGAPIMSAHARSLLNNKAFHYLVNESIQELKQMCQQDWPQFQKFYEKLETKNVNIYSFGVGPSTELNLNNHNSLDGNVDDDDNDDDDDVNY
ncbi:PIH1 domain containing 1 isoform 1-T1 [Cochliomyia hominivorax]